MVHRLNHQCTQWACMMFFGRSLISAPIPSHVHGKIKPHSTQFWSWFSSIGHFFGTPCKGEGYIYIQSSPLRCSWYYICNLSLHWDHLRVAACRGNPLAHPSPCFFDLDLQKIPSLSFLKHIRWLRHIQNYLDRSSFHPASPRGLV